LKPKKTY